MNVNAAEYSPGGPPPSGNNNNYAPHHQQPQHHHHPHNNNMHPRHNNHNNGPRGHQMPPEHHHHGMNNQQHFAPHHHNQGFARQPQHHQHHQHHPNPALSQPQVIMREAVLVLDGVPPRRAETAAVIAQWWRCPSIVDTVTPPKEDDESNPAAALQLAIESYPPDVGRFVIAGFLWNHPHEIHHLGAVLKSKNIVLAAVVFVDTDPADLNPNSFQIHDKPAHPLYCEVATMYFNEKNNFFLTTDDLIMKFKPGANLLKYVDDLQPTPHKPWSSDLRMTDYETVLDIRAAIRDLLGNELSHKFPTHFLTYPLFSRYHETISKKCMVTYDFEGDRGHLVRFNNKDYLIFGTGMVYTATNSYRAPGADAAGITFIFEVHSAKKKDTPNPPRRKESDDVSDSSHFFVTDVVYWKGTRYDAYPYNERQEVVRSAFKNPVGTKWRPVPTVEVSKFNWKSEVDFEIAGYQFYEMGGNNRVFLFKIMETSTANLRLWGGGSQDEKTYCWTFQGNMLGTDEAEIEMPNTDIVVAAEIVDQEKVHFGTVVRARMEKPSRQAGPGPRKIIWRVVDRNWTTNYPTGIARTSSPWTVEGLFNALLTLNSK